jgi:hypothetical protein
MTQFMSVVKAEDRDFIGPREFIPTLFTGWFSAIVMIVAFITIGITVGSIVYYLTAVSHIDRIDTDVWSGAATFLFELVLLWSEVSHSIANGFD